MAAGMAAGAAAAEQDAVSEEDEAAVLAWLMAQEGVVDAVNLALEDREDEAGPALTSAVRALLEEPGPADAAPEGDGGPARASRKRPRSGAAGRARCVCVVVCGLRGCGKSTLCNILREVLGGMWLDYDEFASKQVSKAAARAAFAKHLQHTLAKSLSTSDQDRYGRVVLVDKLSTTRQHRRDVLHELKRLHWARRGGRTLLVEFYHEDDYYGYRGDQLSRIQCDKHLALCTGRIRSRGAAHHVLRPSAKLEAALSVAAKTAEMPSPEELKQFDKCLKLEVRGAPAELAMSVIQELRNAGWLPYMRPLEELRPRAESAWQAYQRAESQWRRGAALAAGEDPGPQEDRQGQRRQPAEAAAPAAAEPPAPPAAGPAAAAERRQPAEAALEAAAPSAAEPHAPPAAEPAAVAERRQPAEAAAPSAAEPHALPAAGPAAAAAERRQLAEAAPKAAGPAVAEPHASPAAGPAAAAAQLSGLTLDVLQQALSAALSRAPGQLALGGHWVAEVPEVSTVIAAGNLLPATFVPALRPHVVLLPAESQHAGVSPEQALVMRGALAAIQGSEFQLSMLEIVVEESVVCAVVQLPAALPCAAAVPHVVLGARAGVSTDYVAQVLRDFKVLGKDRATSIPLRAPRPLRARVVLVPAASAELAGAAAAALGH